MDLAPYRHRNCLLRKTLTTQNKEKINMQKPSFLALPGLSLVLLGTTVIALLGWATLCEHALAVDNVYMFSYFRDPDGTERDVFCLFVRWHELPRRQRRRGRHGAHGRHHDARYAHHLRAGQ